MSRVKLSKHGPPWVRCLWRLEMSQSYPTNGAPPLHSLQEHAVLIREDHLGATLAGNQLLVHARMDKSSSMMVKPFRHVSRLPVLEMCSETYAPGHIAGDAHN